MRRHLAFGLVLLGLAWPAPDASAQQPAQRILPSVTAPAPKPHEQNPCQPSFDAAIGRFVQPCKSFGNEPPPADWLDRMVRTVTDPAKALFLADLDGVEREQYARYVQGGPALQASHDADELVASRGAYEAWEGEAERILADAAAAWRESARGLAAPPPPPGPAAVLAGPKALRFPRPTLGSVWPSTRSSVPLTSPWTALLEARAGDEVVVRVDEVLPAAGYLWPDPVLYLVALETGFPPERGRVLAIHDDAPGAPPGLRAVAPADGLYRLLVVPYRPDHAGRITLEAQVDGVVQAAAEAEFFGGSLLAPPSLDPGDPIFAGALEADRTTGHNAVLAWLPPPGVGTGGAYVASNDDLGTLPYLAVPDEAAGLVLVAAFNGAEELAVQVVCSRLSTDRDGDGLGAAVEAWFESCNGPPEEGTACLAPVPRPPDWSPRDTDHDGFSDREELFGVRRCYGELPVPPTQRLGECLRDAEGACLERCPHETALVAEVPLSALDGPDPCRHDIYLEFDFWHDAATERAAVALSELEQGWVARAFEERYRHNREEVGERPGFVGAAYPIRFHFFQDDAVAMPSLSAAAHIPARAARALFFDLFFTPDRKYTNTFHYAVGSHEGGGQSDVLGRAAVIGIGGGTGRTMTVIHETGHLLGLQHNFDRGNPDYTPFHLSVMSYGYAHSLPPPIAWDGTFRTCHPDANPCPEYFRCVPFPGHGSLCAPDCGVVDRVEGRSHFARLSSGELPVVEGQSEANGIVEEGYPEWFLPYLYCWGAADRKTTYARRLARFVSPHCPGGRCVHCREGVCAIDWDQNGRFERTAAIDLDRDGKINSNPFQDGDDLGRVLARGARGLRVTHKGSPAAFYTHFSPPGGGNVLPFPALVHERHGGTVSDVTNRCDEVARWSHCRNRFRSQAALFRGPASGDGAVEVRLPAENCLAAAEGLTVSLRAKPLAIPTGEEGALLFGSDVLQILLAGSPGKPEWRVRVRTGAKAWEELTVTDDRALGRWSRITVTVPRGAGKIRVSVRRGTTNLQEEEGFSGGFGRVCDFAVGAARGGTSRFTGFLDDPMVLQGPNKPLL